MRIVVDGMGGDYAPREPVAGAVLALKKYSDVQITLVGYEDQLQQELAKHDYPEERIKIVHTSEVVEMGEAPATAIRKKKDSSIAVGASLIKKSEADAFVSSGNTGACMAAGLLKIGRIKGISRPAIATVMPNIKDLTVVLDSGANVDVGWEELTQFAMMGDIFAKKVLRKNNPRIGLLNIGEEEHKGNKLTHDTYSKLQKSALNFIGNIEGRDIFQNTVDVVVCDGFVGNIVLKTTEGIAQTIFQILKEEIKASKLAQIGALLLKPALEKLKKRLDYSEYGGAPLLGLQGIVIISHGSSNAWAIYNAIRIARESILNDLIENIKENVSEEGGIEE